mmetsp:Transcript_14371/g.19207  ORF Transcript_14371/g.19207 Transcript_14371/m.19207 type:complete len:425 (-) Transcript_14371:898-2172(-)
MNTEYGDVTWTPKVNSFLGILCESNLSNTQLKMSIGAKIEELVTSIGFKPGTDRADSPWCAALEDARKHLDKPLTIRQKLIQDNFRRVCGSLIYINITCRPDLSTAVGFACRGMASPTRFHIMLLERTLLYAYQNKDLGLCYTSARSSIDTDVIDTLAAKYPEINTGVTYQALDGSQRRIPYYAFSDANFGDLSDEKLRSTTGFCVYVFGCLVAWSSKRQTLTAKSSMESEIIAMASASDECMWIHGLITSCPVPFGFDANTKDFPPIPLLADNMAALTVANYPKTTGASKHLDLRLFRIRDCLGADGDYPRLRCLWCPTLFNVADHFSKLLKSIAFPRLVRHIVDMPYNATADSRKASATTKSCPQATAYVLITNYSWPAYGTTDHLYLVNHAQVAAYRHRPSDPFWLPHNAITLDTVDPDID